MYTASKIANTMQIPNTVIGDLKTPNNLASCALNSYPHFGHFTEAKFSN
jgi:hypothetical protein